MLDGFDVGAGYTKEGQIFYTLREAQVIIEGWRREYVEVARAAKDER